MRTSNRHTEPHIIKCLVMRNNAYKGQTVNNTHLSTMVLNKATQSYKFGCHCFGESILCHLALQSSRRKPEEWHETAVAFSLAELAKMARYLIQGLLSETYWRSFSWLTPDTIPNLEKLPTLLNTSLRHCLICSYITVYNYQYGNLYSKNTII